MIDTRDLLDEMEELEAASELGRLGDTDQERLDALRVLRDEIEDYSDDSFSDGIFLIPESDFVEYAREFAEDVGLVKDDVSWPYTCIDWDKAADELRMDYSLVTFDGVDYLYR